MKIAGMFFTLLLTSVTAVAQQLGFSFTSDQHRVQFPIEVVNNLTIVPVVINGQIPLNFILDTGVRTAILTQKSFADILHLPYSRKYTVAGPGGEKLVEAYICNNITIDMPGIHGEGHAMLVLEKDYLELRNYLGTEVHGVLGYELFSRFIVEINYSEKRIAFTKPEYFKPRKGFVAIPITIEDTKPYLTAQVEMKSGTVVKSKLLIDSGASHGVILDPGTDNQLAVPQKSVNSQIGRGLGGVIYGKIARIRSISLGKYRIDNVVANFPDANSYYDTLKSTEVFRNGSLGGEMLSRFTTIYDFPGERIYLRKNSHFGDRFHFNMTGLTLKAKGAFLRKYEITDVRKNSPGEKSGILVGDELAVVNGVAAQELDLDIINGFFNSKPGRKIKLEVIREGKRLAFTVVMESPI